MLESLQDIVVRLHRPSTIAPWGFRLQGGAGTPNPLSIQRVFAGGPADGQLIRGDVLVSVDGLDVFNAPHFVAEEHIKKAGRELLLSIKRGSSSVQGSPRNENLHHQSHVDYPFDMDKGPEEYEHARHMNEIRHKFEEPNDVRPRGLIQNNAHPGSTSYLPKRPNISKSFGNKNAPEFGWVPKTRDVPDYQLRYRPHHVQQVLSSEEKYYTLPRENIRHEQYERPAWLGTLRSSGGPKPWEVQEGINLTGGRQEEHHDSRRQLAAPVSSSTFHVVNATRAVHQPKLQITKFSNKGFSGYEQRPLDQSHQNSKVAHLQYNSPISIYSKQNAEEAFTSQTGNSSGPRPWASFDSTHSNVFQMVREEDKKRRGQQHRHYHHQPTDQRGPQRSSRLEHLIHENDDQQLSYGELRQPHVFREKMAISDF